MKRLIFVSVLVIAGGAILSELIRKDAGYVLIAFGTTTVEMSFWVAITGLLATLLALWLIVFLCKRLYRLLTGGLGLAAKRSRKVEERTTSGLIHFVESNWRVARRDLLKAAKHAQNPLVHYLAAARCSYELGDREQSRKLLHHAEKIAPDNELAVTLSQARIQLLDKKYEQCLASLERARQLSPHHPTVLDLLRQVYWQLRDWPSLKALLPELRKQKLYSDEEQELLEQNVYMALLSSASTQAGSDTERAEKQLGEVWQSMPKSLRRRDAVVALYSKLLMKAHSHASAEKVLRSRLNEAWSSELVTLYGLVTSPQVKEQLATAEKWLREHPRDPDLFLALGRISMRNELWGKAREYFENSLAIKPCPESYAELARLLAFLGEHEKSTELYQQGLLATTHGLPPLPASDKRIAIVQ
jgi:HemY protein